MDGAQILVWAVLLSPFATALAILLWAAGSFLIEVWRCHQPCPDLRERVQAYPSHSIADEAQRWLDRQI